jgi:hypothetical protein
VEAYVGEEKAAAAADKSISPGAMLVDEPFGLGRSLGHASFLNTTAHSHMQEPNTAHMKNYDDEQTAPPRERAILSEIQKKRTSCGCLRSHRCSENRWVAAIHPPSPGFEGLASWPARPLHLPGEKDRCFEHEPLADGMQGLELCLVISQNNKAHDRHCAAFHIALRGSD